MTREYQHAPNGGYGWVVAIASHVTLVISAGVMASLGMFLPSFMEEFDDVTDAVISLLAASCLGTVFMLAPLTCHMMLHFGCRTVVMLGGFISMCGFVVISIAPDGVIAMVAGVWLLLGIGFALTFTPSLAIISGYFTTKFSIANAIVYAGIGVGSLIFPPLFDSLITSYGWRGAALITAGLCLQKCTCGALIRPIRFSEDVITQEDVINESEQDAVNRMVNGGRDDLSNVNTADEDESAKLIADNRKENLHSKYWAYLEMHVKLLTECPLILCLALASFFYEMSYLAFLIFTPQLSLDLGLASSQTAWLLSAAGLASTIMRALYPIIVAMGGVKTLPLFLASLILLAVSMMAVPLLDTFALLTVACVAIGSGVGTSVSLSSEVAKEIVITKERHVLAIGWVYLFQGFGNVISGYLGGLLGEWSGNYSLVILSGGICNVFAALLTVVIWMQLRRRHQ